MQEYDTTKQSQLCRQETNIEFEFLRQQLIRKEDLITSSRNLAALASLYRSIVRVSSCAVQHNANQLPGLVLQRAKLNEDNP